VDARSTPTSTASSARTALLAEIFRRIGTTNKQCFEVRRRGRQVVQQLAPADRRRLVGGADRGRRANWPELDKLDDPPRVNVVHGKAEPSGPNSLDSILRSAGSTSARTWA
jgi:hypothetical protein